MYSKDIKTATLEELFTFLFACTAMISAPLMTDYNAHLQELRRRCEKYGIPNEVSYNDG